LFLFFNNFGGRKTKGQTKNQKPIPQVKYTELTQVLMNVDLLLDDKISDGAKVIHCKIGRFAYETGYCTATNKELDRTETGRSASRYISELIRTGYLESQIDSNGTRILKWR